MAASCSDSTARPIQSGNGFFSIPQRVMVHGVAGTQGNLTATGFLTIEEQGALSISAKSLCSSISLPREARILQKFLLCVAHGEQEKAQALLTISHGTPSKWLLGRGEFTDYSGRTFKCSAYEYAYWAKDTHMCRMLETHMDNETKGLVLERINTMEKMDEATGQPRGLEYQQHGQIHRSAHFDLTPLKTALQTYVNGCVAWRAARNRDAMAEAWMDVGKAQRNFPAHVAQEYCRTDRAFDPCPQFNERILPRDLTFDNWITNEAESWFPLAAGGSGLGFDFALMNLSREQLPCGAWMGWSSVRGGGGLGQGADVDLAAISRLDEVRTVDLRQSRENLRMGQFDANIKQLKSVASNPLLNPNVKKSLNAVIDCIQQPKYKALGFREKTKITKMTLLFVDGEITPQEYKRVIQKRYLGKQGSLELKNLGATLMVLAVAVSTCLLVAGTPLVGSLLIGAGLGMGGLGVFGIGQGSGVSKPLHEILNASSTFASLRAV